MAETTFVLIRHGHTEQNGPSAQLRLSGVTDFPLSERGRSEAKRLAAFYTARGERFAAICSSPLSRARDTALELVAGELGKLVIVEDLREIDCGELEGQEIEIVKRRYPALWAANMRQDDADFRWPGGESYRVFRDRCLAAARQLAARYAGARIALVTHAGVVSQLVGSLMGASAASWELYRPGNTAVTELRWEGDTGRLVRFDDRSHCSHH